MLRCRRGARESRSRPSAALSAGRASISPAGVGGDIDLARRQPPSPSSRVFNRICRESADMDRASLESGALPFFRLLLTSSTPGRCRISDGVKSLRWISDRTRRIRCLDRLRALCGEAQGFDESGLVRTWLSATLKTGAQPGIAAEANEHEPPNSRRFADDRSERHEQHPGVERRNVTVPMTAQVTRNGCCRKAIVTPAAAASMLLATQPGKRRSRDQRHPGCRHRPP